MASETEVESLDLSTSPCNRFGGNTGMVGIHVGSFALLHNILSGVDVELSVQMHVLHRSVSNNGPWLYRFPDELASAIADLTYDESDSAAASWATTDELRTSRWTFDSLDTLLSTLPSLFQVARESGRSVFMWTRESTASESPADEVDRIDSSCLFEAYCSILEFGLENLQRNSGRDEYLHVEIAHLHNIPSYMRDDQLIAHAYYYCNERPLYIERLNVIREAGIPCMIPRYSPHWDTIRGALTPYADVINAMHFTETL